MAVTEEQSQQSRSRKVDAFVFDCVCHIFNFDPANALGPPGHGNRGGRPAYDDPDEALRPGLLQGNHRLRLRARPVLPRRPAGARRIST